MFKVPEPEFNRIDGQRFGDHVQLLFPGRPGGHAAVAALGNGATSVTLPVPVEGSLVIYIDKASLKSV